MDSKQFNKYLKCALAEIGYANSKDICFHSWRHFFIARMLDYVQDKRYVMALPVIRQKPCLIITERILKMKKLLIWPAML
jgi:hypothetical protein